MVVTHNYYDNKGNFLYSVEEEMELPETEEPDEVTTDEMAAAILEGVNEV